jgi:ribonuclease Z
MLLRPEFLNGLFGDPALYVWEINEREALLVDCGDLSRFAPKQLLKVHYIFLSHCHMDHFFGFDTFLRIHMGVDKSIQIFGPPETSLRVAGKLQGYTWNLIDDQTLEFIVSDLDSTERKKTITRFRAGNRFKPEPLGVEFWDPKEPILTTPIYQVRTVELDHRTPSLAYSIEEKVTVRLNTSVLQEMGVKADPWIGELKSRFLFEKMKGEFLEVPLEKGGTQKFAVGELAEKLLIPKQRHKISYATDGAAHPGNRERLLELVHDSDLFLSETCFLQEDFNLAEDTKHFTASFMGDLAREAKVKKLAPFHFSKRYLTDPKKVLREVKRYYGGEVVNLSHESHLL